MRTCNTCGKSIDHKRSDAKFCDATCKAKRRPSSTEPPSAPTLPAARPPDEPVYGDLGAALAAAEASARPPTVPPPPTESVGRGRGRPSARPDEPDTDSVSGSRGLQSASAGTVALSSLVDAPLRTGPDPHQILAADVDDLHERLDEGLKKLQERPTKAEVSAMIVAALAPLRREIDRVDRSSASTDATDGLHLRLDTFEEQLLGFPQDRWDGTEDGRPAVLALAAPTRLAELEKAIWGYAATEPDNSVDVHEGDPAHVLGKLEVLDHRTTGIREDIDNVEEHLAAFIAVMTEIVFKKHGFDLRPALREQLAKAARAANEKRTGLRQA